MRDEDDDDDDASNTISTQGRINHLGAPYQCKAGALFWYAEPGFSLGFWECTFLTPKKLTTFFLSSLRLGLYQTFAQRLDVKTAW